MVEIVSSTSKLIYSRNALFKSVNGKFIPVNALQWILGIWIIPDSTIQLILTSELDEG